MADRIKRHISDEGLSRILPLDAGFRAFQDFVEELPVMVYALQPRPPYSPIYVSPAFAQFGYPLDEWRKDPNIWTRVIHPDDQAWVFNETQLSTRTGTEVEYEYRVIKASGETRWVHDRGCLVHDEKGKIIRRQGVIFDITAQKLADQELQKREKLYRTLARSIPRTAVLLFDRDFRYTLADGQQLERHGFSQEILENKTLQEAFPPEVAAEWSGYYRRALAGEEVVFENENEDGVFQLYVLPVKDEKDEIFAGMVMWQDITERKKAETDLKESEGRYRTLFENANDIIYVHDLEGNYLSLNQAGQRALGYTLDEALTLNMRQLMTPEHLELAKAKLADKIEGVTRQTTYEAECFSKDGRRLTLEINSSIIYKDGVPAAVQGIARDVTERKLADEALRESESQFRALAETASDAIVTIDEDGVIMFLNAGTETMFGYSENEMLGQPITMLMPERMRSKHGAAFARFLKTGQRKISWKSVELPGLHKHGHEIHLELSFAEYNKSGHRCFTSVIRDITARMRADEALRESESRFRDLFENANDLIYTHDLDGNFTSLNRAGEIITGYSRDEAVTMNISEVVAPEFLESARKMIAEKVMGERSTSYELEIISKDGNRVSLELSTRLIMHDNKPVGVQGIGRDVTARKLAEESLWHNARHDTLTCLPNRAEFMTHLKQSVRRAEANEQSRFAVLFLDLDRFKVVNDSLGHLIGDKLLIAIAERLTACVRPGDIVARLGGDEFTILLNRTGSTSDVENVAERLQRKIAEPFKIDNYEVFASASIGIVVSDHVKRQAEDYLRDADAAMYRAKESGKARYEVFDRQMHVRNMNLLQIETDLRHAIERNEMEVYYQPIVNLETGELKEFEALLRWDHPKHGLVAPNEFIGAAEETGLIIPIGKWILEEACRQTVAWQQKFHIPYTISVNLSAKQLMHPSLTEQVREILHKTELNPRLLKMEVTESTVMEHSEALLSVLSELYALGISFSTDDFGTGYSSLSYLHRFPFERLKIDRSFVSKMDDDKKCGAIVKTILMLGENLNIEVVAEGIETERQLELLRSYGCMTGQGYLFSRPVPAKDAEKLLRNGLRSVSLDWKIPFHTSKQIIEATKVQ